MIRLTQKCLKSGLEGRLKTFASSLILGAALSACATTPQVRPVDGPIVLDAPDAVVTAGDLIPAPIPSAPSQPDPSYEDIQTVPVTPVNCPAGTLTQPDGSCMLSN